jgi:hypothetical protein
MGELVDRAFVICMWKDKAIFYVQNWLDFENMFKSTYCKFIDGSKASLPV